MKVSIIHKFFIKDNPVFILLLGLCPTLAVTTSAFNSIGMGLATTFVLFFSNIFVSIISRFIPDQIRIPVFITVIASFVTITDLLMAAFFPAVHKSLGIFIPLIVVNCIILGRAEAFASRNGLGPSILDAIGKGISFTFALFLLGSTRELLGNGSILGFDLLGQNYKPILIMILPPGAFLLMGMFVAFFQSRKGCS